MHQVLLIEDSLDYQMIVNRALANLAIQFTVVSSIEEAFKIFKDSAEPFDLVILDLNLPDGEGLSILEYLNSPSYVHETSVFMLTGNNELSSKVAAFNLGAEDYLVKPISPLELRARIEMRLRKLSSRRKNSKECKRGILTLEANMMKAWVQSANQEEKEVELTSKEFKILYCLAYEHQRVFSRAELVKDVWGSNVHVLERTVDSHICAIRRKLGESFIECVPGVGYRFTYPEKLLASS